mmetsp:Transcript_30715/g.94886  ORF Transcript_30715/g.94886 Transcript_30715/m.94886 type:complete len:247 (+) Transcript_30715:274-1014(+)
MPRTAATMASRSASAVLTACSMTGAADLRRAATCSSPSFWATKLANLLALVRSDVTSSLICLMSTRVSPLSGRSSSTTSWIAGFFCDTSPTSTCTSVALPSLVRIALNLSRSPILNALARSLRVPSLRWFPTLRMYLSRLGNCRDCFTQPAASVTASARSRMSSAWWGSCSFMSHASTRAWNPFTPTAMMKKRTGGVRASFTAGSVLSSLSTYGVTALRSSGVGAMLAMPSSWSSVSTDSSKVSMA